MQKLSKYSEKTKYSRLRLIWSLGQEQNHNNSINSLSDACLASPNPLPFSHLSLQESALGADVGGPVSSFTYDEVPESEYCNVFTATATRGTLYTVPAIAKLLLACGNG